MVNDKSNSSAPFCRFCFTAALCDDLTVFNDLSYSGLGASHPPYRIMMRSGSGRNAALLFEVRGQHWETMAFYYPKFCPECRRKLESYGRG